VTAIFDAIDASPLLFDSMSILAMLIGVGLVIRAKRNTSK
jgi:hypothetical protein